MQRGAREETSRLKTLIDQGKDPRQVAADEVEAVQAKREAKAAAVLEAEQTERRHQITLGEAWPEYIKVRRAKWSERHLFDHQKVILAQRVIPPET